MSSSRSLINVFKRAGPKWLHCSLKRRRNQLLPSLRLRLPRHGCDVPSSQRRHLSRLRLCGAVTRCLGAHGGTRETSPERLNTTSPSCCSVAAGQGRVALLGVSSPGWPFRKPGQTNGHFIHTRFYSHTPAHVCTVTQLQYFNLQQKSFILAPFSPPAVSGAARAR